MTMILGALVTHKTRAGWLDTAVEARVRSSLGGEPAILNLLVQLGDPMPVTVMTAALVLACLATRRWRGAVLVAVAIPAAGAIEQLLLKPLIDRTLLGYLSFPSGRATSVFALAVAIAVLLVDPPHSRMPPTLRLLLAFIASLVAGGVAVAVVDEGIHYFTDVVGGAAVGTGVVLLIALILDLLAQFLAHGHQGRPGLRGPWRCVFTAGSSAGKGSESLPDKRPTAVPRRDPPAPACARLRPSWRD